MNLMPDEFWRLTPGQFALMLEGMLDEREHQQRQHAKVLFLLRYPAAMAQAESTGKKVDPLDIMYIPEFDDHIRTAREQHKKLQQKRAVRTLEKYKALE